MTAELSIENAITGLSGENLPAYQVE